jgi:hypothetical protein
MTERVRDMEDLQREILEELQEDYIGLWEVARLVGAELDTDEEAVIHENTLHLVESMLMHGLIRPGAPTVEGDFLPWDEAENPGKSLLRISQEWERLGRLPSLGDITWFDLTDFGERYAAS